MPSIQVLDNPYQNEMGQAAQGISGLTAAASELEKRRAMRWQTIKDIPGKMGRMARAQFEADAGYTPGLIDRITDYLTDKSSKGLATLSAEPSSAIERTAEVVPQPAPQPAAGPNRNAHLGIRPSVSAPAPAPQPIAGPTGENPNYDPNRVSQSTIDMLGGDAETLRRGRSVQLSNPVASISRNPQTGEETYSVGGRETGSDEFAAQLAEAQDLANQFDQNAKDRQRKIAAVKRSMGRNPGIDPDFTNWAISHGVRMDGPNLASAIKAYTERGLGPEPKITVSDIARAKGPVVYKDPTPAPAAPVQQAVAQQPVQQVSAQPRGQSAYSMSSRSGDPVFWNNSGSLSDEEIDYLYRSIPDYSTPTEALATLKAIADRIADPDKQAAARRYIEDLFPQQMSSYDNGVMHQKQSERYSTRQGSYGPGEGSGGSGIAGDGYILVAGNQGSSARRITRISTGNPVADSIGAIIGLEYHDPKEIRSRTQDVMRLAQQAESKKRENMTKAEAIAVRIMDAATGDMGSALVNSKLSSDKATDGKVYKLEEGIQIGNVSQLVKSLPRVVAYDGPETELDEGSEDSPARLFKGNQIIRKGDVAEAGIVSSAKKINGSKKTVSEVSKK